MGRIINGDIRLAKVPSCLAKERLYKLIILEMELSRGDIVFLPSKAPPEHPIMPCAHYSALKLSAPKAMCPNIRTRRKQPSPAIRTTPILLSWRKMIEVGSFLTSSPRKPAESEKEKGHPDYILRRKMIAVGSSATSSPPKTDVARKKENARISIDA